MVKIVIPNFRCPSRNATTRKHWTRYYAAKEEMFSLIKGYCKPPKKPFDRYRVVVEAYYKGKRHIDPSNIDTKLVCDALMNAKVVDDDNGYQNLSVEVMVKPEAGKDELVIVVEKAWRVE